MNSSISVAVVEDDEDLRTILARGLASVGFVVDQYESTEGLETAMASRRPDIVVLDVNLPGENGFVAAARLRARSMVGLVMLTGRTDHADRLLGLSMGVDHYLSKPVDFHELESVIRNLARRLGRVEDPVPPPASTAAASMWTLDLDGWRITAPNGMVAELSAAEYQVLNAMLASPGQPASRDAINLKLGKSRLNADNRSLDVLVSRTRRKIEAATGQVLPLRAARGAGYVFTGLARVEGEAH